MPYKDREAYLGYQREYAKKNREKANERQRRWERKDRAANPEKYRAKDNARPNRSRTAEEARAYYAKNRKRILEWQRTWLKQLPEEKREKYRARRRVYIRNYLEKNPEKGRLHHRKRSAQKRLAPGHVSDRDWKRLINRHRGLCAYCGTEPYAHMDHVVPLSRGGRHSIGNVLPACPLCNLGKSARLLSEWRYSSRAA
jgi:5-methylcytosine-specific restriction endonuclease McrA